MNVGFENKKRILIVVPSGYIFEEYYTSLINELSKDYVIDLIYTNFFVNEDVKASFRKLQITEKIMNLYSVELAKGLFSLWQVSSVIKSLQSVHHDLVLISFDSDILSRAIHFLCAKNKIIRVYMGTGTEQLLQNKLMKKEGMFVKMKKFTLYELFKKGLYGILYRIRAWIRITLRQWHKRYLSLVCRFLGISLISNNPKILAVSYVDLDNYDFGLFFYRSVFEAAKIRFPKHQGLRHLKINFDSGGGLNSKADKGLLVCFSQNLSVEMPERKILGWVDKIKCICKMEGIKTVTLRFHPRMQSNLKWPDRIKKHLNIEYLNVDMDYAERSIVGRQNHYKGVLGSPSGLFYSFIYSNFNGFILSMVRMAEEGFDDTEDLLGDIDRLKYIYPSDDSIAKDMLCPEPIIQMKAPTAAEFIKTLI